MIMKHLHSRQKVNKFLVIVLSLSSGFLCKRYTSVWRMVYIFFQYMLKHEVTAGEVYATDLHDILTSFISVSTYMCVPHSTVYCLNAIVSIYSQAETCERATCLPERKPQLTRNVALGSNHLTVFASFEIISACFY